MYDLTAPGTPWLEKPQLPRTGGLVWKHDFDGNFSAQVPGTTFLCYTRGGQRVSASDMTTGQKVFGGDVAAFEVWLATVRPAAAAE